MPHDESEMPLYALGVNFAMQILGAQNSNLKSLLSDKEMELVISGISKTLQEKGPDSRQVLSTYGPTLNVLLNERAVKLVDQEKLQGSLKVEEFLEEHPKTTQTESGLVYLETKQGDGVSPTIQSTVEVHYHGTLLSDGKVFDSSVERGETISFPLGQVIKGWQEGLQLMKEGGKATLLCPSDIAYGDAGSGEVIPGGAFLKFDVELFKVTTPEPTPAPQDDAPIRINLEDILKAQQQQQKEE